MLATRIHTIGHSTRSVDDFVAILQRYEINMVVDVRTIPRSRANPQFNADALAAHLQACGIAYLHLAELGGLRKPRTSGPEASVNAGWRNPSFRGFADYMATPEFDAGLTRLIETAQAHNVTIMCAEAVPWRCHRSLIGDALLVRGVAVNDIIDERSCREHRLTPFARVDGCRITYPPETGLGDQAPMT